MHMKIQTRPKANGATQAFALNGNSNGTEANAPNGKAPSDGRSSKVTAYLGEPTANGSEAQAQSWNGNGSKPQGFTKIPNPLITDRRLTCHGFRLLAYILSLPPNWHLVVRNVRKLFGWPKRTATRYFAELCSTGYVRLILTKDAGSYWQSRRSLDTDWPALKEGESLRGQKGDPQGNGPSSLNKTEYICDGCFAPSEHGLRPTSLSQ